MDTESSGLEKNQEGGPSGSQKRGGKLGEQTEQWPCRMALLFPAAALGGNRSRVLAHVGSPDLVPSGIC